MGRGRGDGGEGQGASIAYAIGDSPEPRWRLYTGPFSIANDASVRAVAVRYGFAESIEFVLDR